MLSMIGGLVGVLIGVSSAASRSPHSSPSWRRTRSCWRSACRSRSGCSSASTPPTERHRCARSTRSAMSDPDLDDDLLATEWDRPRSANRLTSVSVAAVVAALTFSGGLLIERQYDSTALAAARGGARAGGSGLALPGIGGGRAGGTRNAGATTGSGGAAAGVGGSAAGVGGSAAGVGGSAAGAGGSAAALGSRRRARGPRAAPGRRAARAAATSLRGTAEQAGPERAARGWRAARRERAREATPRPQGAALRWPSAPSRPSTATP